MHIDFYRTGTMERPVACEIAMKAGSTYTIQPSPLTKLGGCSRCNGKAKSGEALDECLCLHAEENALLEAGRERMGDGAVLYCNT